MAAWILLAAAAAFLRAVSAVTLLSCPANATQINYDDGTVYEICPGTNFNGTTFQSVSGTLSPWDCLEQCNLEPACQRAAYRASDSACQFKANNTMWVTDGNWSSIHFVKRIPQGTHQNTGLGVWTNVLMTPVLPVAAYIVPEYPSASRVMMFSSWNDVDFTNGVAGGQTQFADYNFVTGATSSRTVANTGHDMFCPGISSLQDGRLMVSGGSNAEITSFYNPVSNTFTRGPDMQIPRGYHSTAITSKGQVFTIGGSYSGGIGGKNGELYDPTSNSWSLLNNVPVDPILTSFDLEGMYRRDNHPWLYGWKNGSVFHAGPSRAQHWFNTSGDGSYTVAGIRDTGDDNMCAINVMYDAVAGKIYSAGGSQSYQSSEAYPFAYVTTIGDPYTNSTVVQVANMLYKRGFGNGVVLPDGTVLITGGQNVSRLFNDAGAVLTPELWDPAMPNKTTPLAAAAIPRTYHSLSLLLSDARVMVGGGGLCDTAFNKSDTKCARVTDHPDIEIFSPPYLFNPDNSVATRPVIKTISANTDSSGRVVQVGGTLTVTMDTTGTHTFSMLRMGSVTHTINTDQRRVPIANVLHNQAVWALKLPAEPGILLPGYYFLFAINSNGTPSIGMTVRVSL